VQARQQWKVSTEMAGRASSQAGTLLLLAGCILETRDTPFVYAVTAIAAA
jgi:hypothetical protein